MTEMIAACLIGLRLRKQDDACIGRGLRTFQRFASKETDVWRNAIDEPVEGVEKGSFVIWDSGSIHTGLAEHARRNIPQRVTCSLRAFD